MRALIILSASLAARNNCGYIEAFSPISIANAPPRQQFSSSPRLQQLHAEQPNNALLSDLKEAALQTKEDEEKAASSSSSSDYFIASDFNDEPSVATARAEELKAINNSEGSEGNKLMTAATTTSTEERPQPPKPKLIPTPPPLVFDPSNPKAMIAIVKSFIATDFGIQTVAAAQDNAHSSSLLSDTNFIWVSGNHINDGRTGILTKAEYLTAGQYFDLRGSFPDLEYRAHDFRVFVNEEKEYYHHHHHHHDGESSHDNDDDNDGHDDGNEVTVRFTTLVRGTFSGSSLKLRTKVMEPNGKIMNCPPTSVSITFAADGPQKGKIIKLVTDMVMDRQIGNTQGYSGVAGAAIIAGEEPNEFLSQPPLVVLGRKLFTSQLTYFDEHYGEKTTHLPPFPDTVMIQLAKDVVKANFGLDKPDLLSSEFSYLEPSIGPLNKRRYLEKFSAYNVLDAVRDMDYGIMHYRVDPYNPYRIWVDQRSKGTRTGSIGSVYPKFPVAAYESAPEAMSFSFDDDGYCTRITAAAVLDPLLGNSGGLGGVNGLLYATATPKTALMTRPLSSFFARATKSLFSRVGLSSGADSYKTRDGKIVKRLSPYDKNGLPSTVAPSSSSRAKPYFAAPVVKKSPQQIKPVPPNNAQPETTAYEAKEITPTDAVVTEISSGTNDITDAQIIASSTNSESVSVIKAQELRDKAREARIEAAEAMERAMALKVEVEEEKKKALEAKLEEEQRRLELIEEAKKTLLEAKEAKEKERIQREEEVKKMKQDMKKISPKKKDDVKDSNDDSSTRFPLLTSLSASRAGLKGKQTPPKKTPLPKRSPTLNVFNTSTKKSKSPSAKRSTKTMSQTPKRSPTLNIFSSAPKVSPSTTRAKKPSPTTPSSRSPTMSIMGVGGAPKSNVVKAASKRKPVAKRSSTKNKAVVKPSLAQRSPTLSLLSIGVSPDSKADSKKSSAAEAPAKKSPTLRLFGVGGKEAASNDSSEAKAPAKKSPTISLFGAESKKQSKPQKMIPKDGEAKKVALNSNSAFSCFFGSSDSSPVRDSSSKKAGADSTTTRNKKAVAKKVPTGVPVLKGWKANANNEIQGRVYSSTSFKAGEIITTSPVKGRVQSGTVVVSQSGSKYYLE